MNIYRKKFAIFTSKIGIVHNLRFYLNCLDLFHKISGPECVDCLESPGDEKNHIESDTTVGSNPTQVSYSTISNSTLLVLVPDPTALPSLPGVVVSVFVQHRCRFLDCHNVLSDFI